MIITIHLGDNYAVSYYIIDLVGAATNVQNPTCNKAAYIKTLSNRATANYKLIPIYNLSPKQIHQLAKKSCICIELTSHHYTLPVYLPIVSATYKAARILTQMGGKAIYTRVSAQ